MENIKKYIISLGYTLGIILIFTIILTILNYFDLLGVKVINILKLIIPIIATIVGAYHVGNNSDRKGYQTGIKYGIYDMSGGTSEYVMGVYSNTKGLSGFNSLPDENIIIIIQNHLILIMH